MHKIRLAAAAFVGLSAATILGATAAPSPTGIHAAPSRPMVTHVDYQWNHRHWRHHHWHHRHWHHRHWHHRHWEHGHWRYYN